MPIINTIDEKEKIIYTTCSGVMENKDFDDYLIRIWGHDKYFYYNELFDTVNDADWNSFDYNYLIGFAQAAAKLKTINTETKLAWIVIEGKQKELTDFYKAAKSFTNVKSRALESFESKEKALQWLRQK